MNCQETKNLWGPCYDGELDAALRAKIEEHLQTCPACRQHFAARNQVNTFLNQALKQGCLTHSLWQAEESAVRAAFQNANTPAPTKVQPPSPPPTECVPFWRALLWPKPAFYLGLAALWMVLLVVNGQVSYSPAATVKISGFSSQKKAILEEQRREFQAFMATTEMEPIPETKPASPRGDRRSRPAQPSA